MARASSHLPIREDEMTRGDAFERNNVFLSVVALLIAPAPPLQASRPALSGFIVGYKAEQGGASLLEEVPTGETVQKWTRMVTTQKFDNIAYRLSPDRMMGSLATNYITHASAALLRRLAAMATSARYGRIAQKIRKPDCRKRCWPERSPTKVRCTSFRSLGEGFRPRRTLLGVKLT